MNNSKAYMPSNNLIDLSERRIPYDKVMQEKIIHLTSQEEIFDKLNQKMDLMRKVLFVIENGGTAYERKEIQKLLPEFEELCSSELLKKLKQQVLGLAQESYLKRMINIYHELFNLTRRTTGHLFENLTYNSDDKYDPKKNGTLHTITKEQKTVVFFTLVYELFLQKMEEKRKPKEPRIRKSSKEKIR